MSEETKNSNGECNCIAELEQEICDQANRTKRYKKTVLKVEMKGKVFSITGSTLKSQTVTEFELHLDGQKRKAATTVRHCFCAFCGAEK